MVDTATTDVLSQLLPETLIRDLADKRAYWVCNYTPLTMGYLQVAKIKTHPEIDRGPHLWVARQDSRFDWIIKPEGEPLWKSLHTLIQRFHKDAEESDAAFLAGLWAGRYG